MFLFHKIPPQKLISCLRFATLGKLFVFSFAYFICLKILDTWGLKKTLKLYQIHFNFLELLPARMASYLFAIVNYNAGQIALAYFIKNKKKENFFKIIGILFLSLMMDLWIVLLITFKMSFLVPFSFEGFLINPFIQKFSVFFFAGFLFTLSYWRLPLLQNLKNKKYLRILAKLEELSFFKIFKEAPLIFYIQIALYRLPVMLLVMFSYYFAFQAFQMHIPILTSATIVPMIMLVGALPITPAGLGTQQAATIEFFKDKVSSPLFNTQQVNAPELLLAFSITWVFLNYFYKALAGYISLKWVGKDYFSQGGDPSLPV